MILGFNDIIGKALISSLAITYGIRSDEENKK